MKFLFAKSLAVTGTLLLSQSVFAAPVTIDFENTLPTVWGLSSYQQDGFTVSSNVPSGTLIDDNNTVRGNLGFFSGGTDSQTMFWGANGSQSTLSLSGDNGEVFDLLGLDASSLYNFSGALVLTGTLSGGGTVIQTLMLNSDLTSYLVSGMDGLSGLSLSFDGAGYAPPFDLDNIELNVIPVPGAVWLFASALGFLGWRRKRAQ